MKDTSNTPATGGMTAWTRATWLRAGAAAALGLVLAVCGPHLDQRSVPPQGWWAGHGSTLPHDTFPADCTLCHEGNSWTAILADFEYDHGAETGFALQGAHETAQCLRCHNDRGPVQVYSSRGCGGCHDDPHDRNLGENCGGCHDEQDWRVTEAIAQHNRTRLPLVGAHVSTPCWSCHEGAEVGNFTPVNPDCTGCHLDDLARATDPDHALQGWTDGCERCHIATDWTGPGFNHTVFPLVGGHDISNCADCHLSGVFVRESALCIGCHQSEFDRATDPPHVAKSFPTDCERCHDVFSFEGAIFNHAGFANGCDVCHLDEYQAATDPNHQNIGMPRICEFCHYTDSWAPSTYDHDEFWPLIDFHALVWCVDCHGSDTVFTTNTCLGCHTQSQMDPAHRGIPRYVFADRACLACHPDGN